MKRAGCWLTVFVPLAAWSLEAAAQDPSNEIYREDRVATFRLTMSAASWNAICNDGGGVGDTWQRADMTWQSEPVVVGVVERPSVNAPDAATPLDDLRQHGRAGAQHRQPGDDDRIPRRYGAAQDFRPPRRPHTDRHLAAIGFAILHDPDERPLLQRHERILRYDDRGGANLGREARFDEHAGLQAALRIRHPRLDEDRAGRQLDHGVHEHHFTREVLSRQRGDLEAHELPAAQPLGVALGDLKDCVLRVHRLERDQRRLAVDVGADAHEPPAINGRATWDSDFEFDSQYLLVKSTNGGQAWSSPTFVVGMEDGSADYPINVHGRQTLTGYQVRVWGLGNIVASPTANGTLYLVFSDNRNGVHDVAEPITNTDVFLMTSSNGGSSWSGPILVDSGAGDQWFPWVEVNPTNGEIGILYHDRGASNGPLYNTALAEGTPGSLVKTIVSTAPSNPTQSRYFRAGVTGCANCATFHGDYINISYGSDGKANMAWTDMRDPSDIPGLFYQFIYYAQQ